MTLYEQIYTILGRRIATGELAEGSTLPNEFDLSQEFGVSVGTLRKALDQIVRERLLLRHAGRGTIVCNEKRIEERERIQHIRFGESGDIGLWVYHELEYRLIPAAETVAQKLRIQPDDTVHFFSPRSTNFAHGRNSGRGFYACRFLSGF